MIGKIKGKLSEVEGNVGLIETVGGVFYHVYIAPAVTDKIKVKDQINLYTYLQVREDALVLFGFQTKEEYSFFKMLLSVPGVGPKTAFSVISFSKINELINAVKKNDGEFFKRIPGLGKKTTMKIILELSQKVNSEFKLENMYLSEEDKTVIDALISLGFKMHEAKKIFSKIPRNLKLEDKIKFALKTTQTK